MEDTHDELITSSLPTLSSTTSITPSKSTSNLSTAKSIEYDIYVLVASICFGSGSWLTTNAIFCELPTLVHTQPEKSTLPTYFGIVQQVANVIMFVISPFLVGSMTIQTRDRLVGLSIISMVVGMFVLAFTWEYTITIGDHHVSIALLLHSLVQFTFCALGSVVFWTYMSAYPEKYTFGFSVGQGIASAVTGLLPVAQDAGSKHMRFSTDHYFLIIALFQLLMLGAYIFLQYHPRARAERSRSKRIALQDAAERNSKLNLQFDTAVAQESLTLKRGASVNDQSTAPPLFPEPHLNASPMVPPISPLIAALYETQSSTDPNDFVQPYEANLYNMRLTEILKLDPTVYLSFCFTAIMIYGIYPALLPYACLSYVNGKFIYNISTAFLCATDPLGRALFAIPIVRRVLLTNWGTVIFVTLTVLSSGCCIMLAAMSPHPIGEHSHAWASVPVITSAIMAVCYSMSQTAYFLRFHDIGNKLGEDWAKLYRPKRMRHLLKEAERLEKLEDTWQQKRYQKILAYRKRSELLKSHEVPVPPVSVADPNVKPEARIQKIQDLWRIRRTQRRIRRHYAQTEHSGLPEYSNLPPALSTDERLHNSQSCEIFDDPNEPVDGPSEDESEFEFEHPLACDEQHIVFSEAVPDVPIVTNLNKAKFEELAVNQDSTPLLAQSVSNPLIEKSAAYDALTSKDIDLSQYIKRLPNANEVAATRAHMYTLGGLSVQVGATIGAIAAMLLTLVFKVITEPNDT